MQEYNTITANVPQPQGLLSPAVLCHLQAVSPALTMKTVCFLLIPYPLEELLLLLLHGSPNGLLGVPFLF